MNYSELLTIAPQGISIFVNTAWWHANYVQIWCEYVGH